MRFISVWLFCIIIGSNIYAQPLSSVEITREKGLPCPEMVGVDIYNNKFIISCDAEGSYTYDGINFNPFTKFSLPEDDITAVSSYKEGKIIRGRYKIYFKTVDSMYTFPNSNIGTGHFRHNDSLFIFEFPILYYFNSYTKNLEEVYNIQECIPNPSTSDFNSISFKNRKEFYVEKQSSFDIYNIDGCQKRSVDGQLIVLEDQKIDKYFDQKKGTITTDSGRIVDFRNGNYFSDSPFRIRGVAQGRDVLSYFFFLQDEIGFHLTKVNFENYSFQYLGSRPAVGEVRFMLTENSQILNVGMNGMQMINPFLIEYKNSNSDIPEALYSINKLGNALFFGGYGSGISSYEGGNFNRISLENLNGRSKILPGVFNYNDELLFISEGDKPIIGISPNGETSFKDIIYNGKKSFQKAYYFDTLNNGQLAIGLQDHGIGIVEEVTEGEIVCNSIGPEKGFKLGNVLGFAEDTSGNIWMGRTSTGIAVYSAELDTIQNFLISENKEKGLGGVSFEIDNSGNLWIGTSDGLYFLENPHDFRLFEDDFLENLVEIPMPNGDHSPVVFVKQVNDRIVCGNSSAISFIELGEFYKDRGDYPTYQYRFGYDINGDGAEQNCVFQESEQYLWVGTQRGALRFDLDHLQLDTTQSRITFKEINSGGETLEMSDQRITIAPTKRNLSFKIALDKNRSFLNNVFFEYAFVTNNGRDTLLLEKYITHPTIDLKYLPHGRYQLHITAFKHGRKMDESRIEVRVKPTLIENSTFWIALIGAIIAFFLYVFWQQRALFKRDKAIDQLSKDFEKTRIQSLVSTFNPHFINNSLHWVQSKYAHDKDLTTVIGRLSKNITMIINNSRRGKAHHSLEQELQLVDNYVQIQRIRFSNSFEYRLDIKDEQLKKINLPLMQIQIHVENAIEHGIRNRRASKLVNVKIENDNDFLIIQIIDDGVGRAKAKNLKSQRTQSGTLMLNNVQEFLNKKNKLHISTRYVDNIYGDHGTKVEIKIPLNYTYEL